MQNLIVTQNDIDKFINKTKLVNDCWIWQGATDGRYRGYGRFWINGRYVPCHRFAYYIHNNFIIDPDLCVCHTCDTPLCMNPKHLFQGTYAVNNKDRNSKNRQAKGISCQQTILTEDQVRQILIDIHNNAYRTIEQIQQKYFVGRSVITDILIGRSWKHVTSQLQVPLMSIKHKVIHTPIRNKRLTYDDANLIRDEYKTGISITQLCINHNSTSRQITNIIKFKSFR